MLHMLQENSNSAHTLGVNSLTLSLSVFFFFVVCFTACIYSDLFSTCTSCVVCSETAGS